LKFIFIGNTISFIHTIYLPRRYETQFATDAENTVPFFTLRNKVLVDIVIKLVTQKEKRYFNVEIGGICISVTCTHSTNK